MARPPNQHELFNFVTKFVKLWNAGKQARLFVECEAGVASINLQLHLGNHETHPPTPEHDHPHQPRQPGPSRLRRRARRAAAREVAAANAALVTTASKDAAVQAAVRTADTAVQAVQAADPLPSTAEIAVQVDSPREAAVWDAQHRQPHNDAVQARTSTSLLYSPVVEDRFCPDKEYTMANQSDANRRADVRNTLQMIEDALNR